MIFTFEALNARFGDALMLHYGTADEPHLVVIDAGPQGVYRKSLRPRLDGLRGDAEDPLTIDLLMVSHIDGDHITGVISLTKDLLDRREKGEPLPYRIVRLWYNSFNDLVGDEAEKLSAALAASVESASAGGELPADLPLSRPAAAIVANVPQGRELRDNAERLSLLVNEPPDRLIMAPKAGRKSFDLGGGLTLTVLGPSQQRLEELQSEWDAKLTSLGLAESAESVAADFIDKSVPNLSSIVVLAEAGGRTVLLTGDARGDDIIAGLKSAGLLKGGKIHVDILKLPHHGSDRNVSTDFFRQVTADHYVISADGTYTNPDIPTLGMISTARGDDKFTVHLTNREQRLEDFFAEDRKKGKNYEVVFREDDDAATIRIDLADPLEI